MQTGRRTVSVYSYYFKKWTSHWSAEVHIMSSLDTFLCILCICTFWTFTSFRNKSLGYEHNKTICYCLSVVLQVAEVQGLLFYMFMNLLCGYLRLLGWVIGPLHGLYLRRTWTHPQKMRSIPRVGAKPTISVLQWQKILHFWLRGLS